MANNFKTKNTSEVDPAGSLDGGAVVFASVDTAGVHTPMVGNAGLIASGVSITALQTVGGIARTSGTYVTASSNTSVVASFNAAGNFITKPYASEGADWQYAAASGGITDTTDVAVRAASTSERGYVTGIQLRNANAVATEFVIKDGATVIWRTSLPASMTAPVVVSFATPLRGSVNTALNVACITTAAQVYANVQGYISRA